MKRYMHEGMGGRNMVIGEVGSHGYWSWEIQWLATYRLGPGKPFSSLIPSIKVAEAGNSMVWLWDWGQRPQNLGLTGTGLCPKPRGPRVQEPCVLCMLYMPLTAESLLGHHSKAMSSLSLNASFLVFFPSGFGFMLLHSFYSKGMYSLPFANLPMST